MAVLQLRGEPARFERILGEVLLGLDHLGHLRRLVGTPRTSEPGDEDGRAAERPAGFFGVVSDVPGAPDGAQRGHGPTPMCRDGSAPRRSAVRCLGWRDGTPLVRPGPPHARAHPQGDAPP